MSVVPAVPPVRAAAVETAVPSGRGVGSGRAGVIGPSGSGAAKLRYLPASERKPAPYDPAAEEQWFYGQREPSGKGITPQDYANSYAVARAQAAQAPRYAASAVPGVPYGATGSPTWNALGPAPMGTLPGYTYSGRVASLAMSGGTLYDGSASGGVWDTTDGGTNWNPLTDSQPSLATGAVAIDPTNSAIIYVGTGEDDGANGVMCADCFYGEGILKSSNGGSSWTRYGASTFGGYHISKIFIDPNSTSELFAASDNGLFESTDGGTSWSLNAFSGSNVTDLAGYYDASTSSLVLWAAAVGIGLEESTNGGASWTLITGGALPSGASFGRTAIGLSASNPGDLYVSISDPTSGSSFGSLVGLFESTNDGTSWTQLTVPGDYFSQSYCYGSGSSDQGWYDNVVAVDPANPSVVAVAGICLLVSTNGGSSWSSYLASSGHPDYHALFFDSSGDLYMGNDGGVWEIPNAATGGSTMTDLNGDLNTIQFYPGISQYGNASTILGGSQDNGVGRYSGSSPWANYPVGDGDATAINPYDSTQYYYEGDQVLYGQAGIITPRFSDSNWVPPLLLVPNPSNPSSPGLYFGANHVWESSDQGANWASLNTYSNTSSCTGGSQGSPAVGFDCVSALAVAPSDSQVLYAGWGDGTLQISTNGGTNWSTISPGTSDWITHIAVSPTNPYEVYVTYSGTDFPQAFPSGPHVVCTADANNASPTWINVTGNLPSAPTNAVVVDGNYVIAATDVGVYQTSSLNGASTVWSAYGSGLPDVQVVDLLVTAHGMLIAATHGRGAWDVAAPSPAPSSVTISPSNESPGAGSNYTISFTTSPTGALGAGSSITVVLAPGSTVPSSSTSYSVTDSGNNSESVSSVAPGYFDGSSTENGAVIYLSAAGITASDGVTVRIAGATNAPTAGPESGTVATSSDATDTTGSYDIAPPPPTVTGINPTSGPAAGNTAVAITGTNFDTTAGGTTVDFGSTAATGVSVVSSTELTATAPAGPAGTVDVAVTTPSGTSGKSSADRFTYEVPPTVTGVNPASGFAAGGTVVAVTGTNLLSATAVDFGSTAATNFTVDSSTQVTATSPSGTGTVEVTVTTPSGTSAPSSADDFSYIEGSAYVPLAPFRIVDTRCSNPKNQSIQAFGCSSLPGKNANLASLSAGSTETVTVAGTGSGADSVPASGDSAVVVNVTADDFQGGAGYLDLYPGGTLPSVSTLNWPKTATGAVTNLATIPLSSGGTLTVADGAGQGSVDYELDVQGYYVAPKGMSTQGLYDPLAPGRLVDTRCSSSSYKARNATYCASLPPSNAQLLTFVAGTASQTQQVAVDGEAGVPLTGVAAVVLNVTAATTAGGGYFSLYPAGSSLPMASNVNWTSGRTVANRVTVEVPTTRSGPGKISVYDSAKSANLIVDVVGYYTGGSGNAGKGSLFTTVTPTRFVDTRCSAAPPPSFCAQEALPSSDQALPPIQGSSSEKVAVGGVGPVPKGATAFVGNLTAADPSLAGFYSVDPLKIPPSTSDLNFAAGTTVANMVIGGIDSSGEVSVYNSTGTPSNMLIDVTGYFGAVVQ